MHEVEYADATGRRFPDRGDISKITRIIGLRNTEKALLQHFHFMSSRLGIRDLGSRGSGWHNRLVSSLICETTRSEPFQGHHGSIYASLVLSTRSSDQAPQVHRKDRAQNRTCQICHQHHLGGGHCINAPWCPRGRRDRP